MKKYEGSAEHVRERFAEVAERVATAARTAGRVDGEVEILVATKYVDADGLGVLREAGVRLIGENRAQDLADKHARYGDAFTYDFIGHLQSRKTKIVLPLVRLIHSVGSPSVVAEIERRLSVVAALEATIAANLARAGRLRQAVLKCAFEGRLVAQDMSDTTAATTAREDGAPWTVGATGRSPLPR